MAWCMHIDDNTLADLMTVNRDISHKQCETHLQKEQDSINTLRSHLPLRKYLGEGLATFFF